MNGGCVISNSSDVFVESDDNEDHCKVAIIDPLPGNNIVDYVDLGNTYDVIHDHDINHYDEIYRSRPNEGLLIFYL